MRRKTLIVLALILAVGIAVLFILPAYDIQPTAMRASHSAKMIALAIASQILLLFAIKVFGTTSLSPSTFVQREAQDILDLTCSRLR